MDSKAWKANELFCTLLNTNMYYSALIMFATTVSSVPGTGSLRNILCPCLPVIIWKTTLVVHMLCTLCRIWWHIGHTNMLIKMSQSLLLIYYCWVSVSPSITFITFMFYGSQTDLSFFLSLLNSKHLARFMFPGPPPFCRDMSWQGWCWQNDPQSINESGRYSPVSVVTCHVSPGSIISSLSAHLIWTEFTPRYLS